MSEEAEERLMRYFLLTHLCGIFSLRICAVFHTAYGALFL
ncbi:putative membrane protein [Escherichia coli P0299438.2]|nr:putative membrane protein [Escherichia coli P0299438.2]